MGEPEGLVLLRTLNTAERLGKRIDACTEQIRICAAELQSFLAGVECLLKGDTHMNEPYLGLVNRRYTAAVEEMERLQGLPIDVAIIREVVLNALADIPQLVEQVRKLNGESEDRLQQELVERPWERGSQTVTVVGEGPVVVVVDPSGGEKCDVCGGGFTLQEWDERHTDTLSGADVHARCCRQCKIVMDGGVVNAGV